MVIGSLSVPVNGNEIRYVVDGEIVLVKSFVPSAVTVEGTYSDTGKKSTTATISSVIVPTSSDRAIFVFISCITKAEGDAKFTSSVVFQAVGGDQTFVNLGEAQYLQATSSIFRLLAPDQETADILITFDDNNANWDHHLIHAVVMSGVLQSDPEDDWETPSGISSATPTHTVATASGDLVYGLLTVDAQAIGVTYSEDGDGTQQWGYNTPNKAITGGVSFTADDASATLSYTIQYIRGWVFAGISINPVAGGGTNYEEYYYESVSAVDVQTNAADFARDLTESVSSVDVITTAADMIRNLVESVGVVGVLTMIRGREKDLVETIAVADVRTLSADFVRNWVETIAASDVFSKTFGLNRSEAISVVDTIEVSKAIQKSMNEAIAASDVRTTAADYVRNQTESISAIDAQSNAAVFVRDFVEAITAADVLTNAADFARNLVESINVVDIIDAVKGGAIIEAYLTEEITVSDVLATVGGTLVTASMFYQLFLSLEMWGYIGPLALVIGGYFIVKKDRFLGVLWFVVESLVIANYMVLVSETPEYWWHIFILLTGCGFILMYFVGDR